MGRGTGHCRVNAWGSVHCNPISAGLRNQLMGRLAFKKFNCMNTKPSKYLCVYVCVCESVLV